MGPDRTPKTTAAPARQPIPSRNSSRGRQMASSATPIGSSGPADIPAVASQSDVSTQSAPPVSFSQSFAVPEVSRNPYTFPPPTKSSFPTQGLRDTVDVDSQPLRVDAFPEGEDSSLAGTAFSWSPTPQPFPPAPASAFNPAVSSITASESVETERSSKSSVSGRGRGRGRGSRGGSQASQRSQVQGSAASGRDYARWDKKREEDGLSPEGCLVDWIAREGHWRRWKDAKSKDRKTSVSSPSTIILKKTKSKDAIHAKIRAIEDSFKRALTWIHTTGSGAYSLEPDKDGDGRSPYQRELEKRCKYYNTLLASFGERGGMIPQRVYSSINGDDNREAEHDVLLDTDDEKDDDENPQEDADHSLRTPTPASKTKKPAKSSIGGSSSASRSTRGSGLVKTEDISSYLTSKSEYDGKRLELEEKKVKLENRKARAEGIALLLKAGLSLDEARRAWKEDDDEEE
ncbi:hypothetical protein QFC21_006513 [Naganishia friedmannii]|uniref:Uncharacterized protein n=1 Tax=Naganishia friedmannii TaxID=89922 RepID=A0ACC2V2X8_9TREE|nr:hypothetical protein QFC21_006513 [Naganishia friedmannii]